MKNLSTLRRNFSYFLNVVSQKQAPARNALLAIANSVKGRYKIYTKHCSNNELHLFPLSIFNGVDAVNLAECYGKNSEVKKLKELIYKAQPEHIRYECQYCCIGDSTESFDHYLPVSSFPEFSVLSLNLIPCCSKCNSIKGNNWKDAGGSRNIVNMYYDPLPTQSFLRCEVKYKRNTPVIDYYIENTHGIDPLLYQIIDRHFSRLGLLKRFKQRTNTEVLNIKNSFGQLRANTRIKKVSKILLNGRSTNETRLRVQLLESRFEGGAFQKSKVFD